MYASAALWIFAFGYMKAVPPEKPVFPSPLEFTEFRALDPPGVATGLSYPFTVIDNTDATLPVTKFKLEWYEDGLSSGPGNGHPSDVTFEQPYLNSQDRRAGIETIETLKNEESSRYSELFPDNSFLPESVQNPRATLAFSNGATTARDLALP